MPGIDKLVFDTVTRTLRKISFATAPPRTITEDCLVMMNVPSQMAQRDSTYDCAVELLRKLPGVPGEKLFEAYDVIHKLFDISVAASDSIIIMERSVGGESFEFMSKHLLLMRDLVKAARNLVRYEKYLGGEQVPTIITEDNMKILGKYCSDCRNTLWNNVFEQIEIVAPQIKKARTVNLKSFSKENLARYEKSFKEYEKNYKGNI